MTSNANGYASAPEFYFPYGVPDTAPTAQNPTIIPDTDGSLGFPDQTGGGGEVFQFVDTTQFLANYPRLDATGTVTFTGSVTAGDTCSITLVCGVFPGGVVQVSTLAVSGDTLTSIADRLLTLLNSNAVLKLFGVSASLAIVSTNPVITIAWPGPIGNLAILQGQSYLNSETATLGGTATNGDVVTVSMTGTIPGNNAKLAVGGTATQNDVITVSFFNPLLTDGQVDVTYTVGATPTTATIATALASAINSASGLSVLGISASADHANVWLTWSASVGSVSLFASASRAVTETIALAYSAGSPSSAFAPSPAPSYQITVGGTITTGDLITLNVFAAGVQPAVPVTYTVQGGDTTTTIATALAAAFNANAILATGAFVASSLANVVTLTWANTVGQVTLTSAVTALASETFVATIAPQTLSAAYTVGGGDTTTQMATGVKNAINANVAMAAMGIVASSSSAVVTIDWNSGLDLTTFAASVSGAATETVTFAKVSNNKITITGTATTGDSIYARFADAELVGNPVTVSYATTTGQTTTQMATGLAAAINADVALTNGGITASSSSNVVDIIITEPAAFPTITAWSNGAAELDTIGGTLTTGDTLNVVFTSVDLLGSPYTLQYTVAAGDTTTTLLAHSLAAAITADTTLAAAGIAATNVAAAVHITWPGLLASLTFAVSTNGVELATITGTPTNGEQPVITITDSSVTGSPIPVTYTVTGGDTNNSIAAGFAALIMGNAALTSKGITATAVGNVVHIASTSKRQTTYARTNSANTTVTLSGGPTETQTLSGGPTEIPTVTQTAGSEVLTATSPLAGGTGPVIPLRNFIYSNAVDPTGVSSGDVENFWAGKPKNVDYTTLNNLVTQGQPVI
jgi:hypothetical protein